MVTFDPLAAESLPPGTDALVVGGGFPEVHVDQLAANAALRAEVRRRAAAGMPIVAECAGLLWLGATLNARSQCGLVPADARMTGRLTLGYREATALRDTPLLAAGTRVRAHEFHHTVSEPAHGDEPAWQLADGTRHGWAGPSMLASYLHLHWAGLPHAAARLARAAHAASAAEGQSPQAVACAARRSSPQARAASTLARGQQSEAAGNGRPAQSGATRRGPADATRREPPAPGLVVGHVTLVGAGPGSADLITLRGWQALRSADVVISDRLVDPELTAGLRPGVVLIDAGKKPGEHRLSQEDISAELVAQARAGHHVVRLKGGDPFVLGRGGEEVLACAEAGIPCSVVPGLSSATAAPALAGIPLTHRGVAQSFAVVSGHLPPGHPDSPVDWKILARSADTLVLLMAAANLTSIARHLIGLGRPPGTDVACIERAATARQRVSRCTLGDLAGSRSAPAISNPAVIVIGPTVSALLPRDEPPRSRG